jgi:hypothetical protein
MDLRFLEPLYRAAGPVATVYLDTTRTSENAAHEIGLRWRALRERLADLGADEATLAALDGAAGGAKGVPGPQGEALFAAGGRLLAAYTLSRPPQADRAAWLPVPDPLDLVADLDDGVPYVVVAADREGADVAAYPAHGGPVEERQYNGATLHISKVASGGWRHKHYQRRAEEVWSENAAHTAKEIEEAVAAVDAGVVFVGGDERAIGKLREHLSTRTGELVVELASGGRGGSDAMADLRSAVDDGLRETAVALRSGTVLDFTEDLNREGRAVQGVDATAEALRSGQVERLLLAAGGGDAEPTLWASATDPLEVARERTSLTEPAEAFEAPAGALLLRAAQATGASFTRLDGRGDAQDGVGAVLRFTLAAGG